MHPKDKRKLTPERIEYIKKAQAFKKNKEHKGDLSKGRNALLFIMAMSLLGVLGSIKFINTLIEVFYIETVYSLALISLYVLSWYKPYYAFVIALIVFLFMRALILVSEFNIFTVIFQSLYSILILALLFAGMRASKILAPRHHNSDIIDDIGLD